MIASENKYISAVSYIYFGHFHSSKYKKPNTHYKPQLAYHTEKKILAVTTAAATERKIPWTMHSDLNPHNNSCHSCVII